MSILHSKILGDGKPLIVLHGFLGMSDNWKTLGNKFSESFQVHLIDQRNHGRSFHSDLFSYDLMADDLKKYLDYHKIKSCILLGHSMGGKTAMQFTSRYPNMVKKLIVADIAPKEYPAHHQYILKALQDVDFSKVKSRKDIEVVLKQYIKEPGVVQFLMKNVYRKDKLSYGYRFNLPVLTKKYGEVVKNSLESSTLKLPVLFLRGGNSNYISASDMVVIKSLFSNSNIETIEGAGHWLHAEKPEVFYHKVITFC